MMRDFSNFILGETSEHVEIDGSDDQRGAALALVRQARRTVDIFSRDLDKRIYDNRPFLDALQELAVARHGLIRILVKDSGKAVKYGHRLIPLSQRLTSFIEVRKVADDFKEYNEAFLVADETAYAHRKYSDRFEGTVRFSAAKEARELIVFFNEVWRSSAPDPDLQRIYL
jgi:hypothetical protein